MKWFVVIVAAFMITACNRGSEDPLNIAKVSFSNDLAFTQIGNLFTDTVMVTSVGKWEVAEIPAWIKGWEMLDNVENMSSGVSQMRLVFTADNEQFTSERMSGDIVLLAEDGARYALHATFAGFTPYISFDVSELHLAVDPVDSNYYGRVVISSNVNWDILHQCPWCRSITEIVVNRGNGVESMGEVVIGFDRDHHTGFSQMDGRMTFSDLQTGVSHELDVIFPEVAPATGGV